MLILALLVRVTAVVSTTGMPARIDDEHHYLALAGNLTNGFGFGWDADTPTSMRPPLLPFFIASVWRVVGDRSLEAVRWAHIPIALAGIALVYAIGRRWFDERTGLVAAIALALYPGLLFSGVLMLTETLFTTLLLSFVFCVTSVQRGSAVAALAAGGLLGLGALTRSVLWPFVLVAAPLMWFVAPGGRRPRAMAVASLALGFVAVVGPWTARNTALQGTTVVVDTLGGLNLMMGNYAHTPEDRMWDAIGMTGDRAWSAALPATAPDGSAWTEGKKERWARQQAISYILANPLTTLRRSIIKFADFWGLERDFVAGVQRGYYRPPVWVAASGAIFTALAYALAAVLAVVGICLAPPHRHAHVLLLLLLLFLSGVHSIVFGHSRYHLPLVPVLLLYAAAAVTSGRWRQIVTRTPSSYAAAAIVAGLLVIWSREIFVRDAARIASVLGTP